MDLIVGWDWASKTHDVTVLDATGQVVDHWTLAHDEAGLDACLRRLGRHGERASLPVAIETTSGLVVERLLAAGHPVIPVHPNAFHAARPRWGAARAKTDPGDSYKLADYLRTDGHRLPRLAPQDPALRRLQAASRVRDDLVAARVAATNQLAALLGAHWPGAAAICGRRSPAELLQRLRAAPQAPSGLDPDTLTVLVGAQIRVLRSLLAGIGDCERAMRACLDEHAKAALLAPLPRIGQVNLAQLIAEVGPILDRAVDVDHAAVEAGAAPVTRASGSHRQVSFRWQANTRARNALMIFADNSRHASPWAARLYADARRRGKRHPHAIRILARAWLRVIWACWHQGKAYNPDQHAAARRLAAQSTSAA
jgi:transposase